MASQALYRRWRPQTFAEVAGQEPKHAERDVLGEHIGQSYEPGVRVGFQCVDRCSATSRAAADEADPQNVAPRRVSRSSDGQSSAERGCRPSR